MTAAEPVHPHRILIFGGTFDPPHKAHAALPAKAAERLGCDLILFVPAAISPLKSKHPSASPEHRMAMLLLAIADVPNARISTIELDRTTSGGAEPSYTIDTLRELRKEFAHAIPAPMAEARHEASPHHTKAETKLKQQKPHVESHLADEPPEFHLLIGCDQALEFHRWKDWQQILLLATPAVMLRPPWDERSFRNALEEKYSKVEAESWMKWTLRLPSMDISATETRRDLAQGNYDDLLTALDPAVLDYIRVNNLYRSSTGD